MAWLLVSRNNLFKEETKAWKRSFFFASNIRQLLVVIGAITVAALMTFSARAAIEPNWQNQDECFANPMECIQQLRLQLDKTPAQSHKWFGLQNTYLLALWDVGNEKELKEELDAIDIAKAPPVLLTTVYTLKAKFAVFEKNMTLGRVYAERAVSLTKAVNRVSENMYRNAEIVVLYSSYLKENELAKQFVSWVEERLGKKTNLVQMASFNTAVGHLHSNSGQHSIARAYYLRALEGYLTTQYKTRIAKSYHNVARTLQREQKFEEAIKYFTSSLTYYQELGEAYLEMGDYTRLTFAETLLASGRAPQSKFVFSQVNLDTLSEYYTPLYQDLKLKIEQALVKQVH